MSTHSAPAASRGAVIRADIVGHETGSRQATVDARWLMAYAAASGARHPRFFDTTVPGGPPAHPLFAVCYEWPLLVDLRAEVIGEAAASFGVHASHCLAWRRVPRVGDQLSTRARVMAVSARRSGTLMVARLVTVDQRGDTVSETDYGSLFRGVSLEGGEAVVDPLPRPGPEASSVRWSEPLAIPAEAAHIYSECARIWNPIHTDLAVARAAGLPAPILHGTATLALAVSCLMERELASEPTLVRGVGGRFTGMVPVPSTVVVRGRERRADGLAFDVVTPAGAPLISEGVLRL